MYAHELGLPHTYLWGSGVAYLVNSPPNGENTAKLLGWSHHGATPYHFRTAAGQEVDLVLEAPGQRIAGIEVKASANVGQGDFDGLRVLSDAAGDKFSRGVVLYLGEQRLSFAANLWALPIASLWARTGMSAGKTGRDMRRRPLCSLSNFLRIVPDRIGFQHFKYLDP